MFKVGDKVVVNYDIGGCIKPFKPYKVIEARTETILICCEHDVPTWFLINRFKLYINPSKLPVWF